MSAWLVFGVLGLASTGCRDESSSSGNGTVSRPGPEESFTGIVQFVQRQLETGPGSIPGRFVIENGGRRSQFIVRNDVTSELIPPSKQGETYRGKITVESRSTYSLRRTEELDKADANTESDSDKTTEQRSMFDDSDSSSTGIEVLDSDLVAPSSDNRSADTPDGEPTTVVARQEDMNVSTFEFSYENDRWVLKTEPDADTERAIKRAFERALRMQP